METIILILLCLFLSAVLLYMHKIDPMFALLTPLLVFNMPVEGALYFAIMLSGAVIEHKRYKLPDFILFISLFPVFYSKISIFYGVIYSLPIGAFFIYSEVMDKNLMSREDIKCFFSVGVFLQSFYLLLPLYALSIVLFIPYSFFKKKVVPIGPPTIFAALIVYLVMLGR